MPFNVLILFALVQGVTEFLPVSSSGHLQLLHTQVGAPTPRDMLALEIAAHAGTLLAVLAYCARDLVGIGRDTLKSVRQKKSTDGAQLLMTLVIATVPLFAAGWLLYDLIAAYTRNVLLVVAVANLVFAVLLAVADRLFLRVRKLHHLRPLDAIIIGAMQTLALVPGVSRSGIVITAARILSCERQDAARLSLLLSIPAILGAVAVLWSDLPRLDTPLNQLLTLAALSFVVALPAIAFLMKWVRHASYDIFVIYRLLFAAVIFAVIAGVIPGS